jgi:hypothetical protein
MTAWLIIILICLLALTVIVASIDDDMADL